MPTGSAVVADIMDIGRYILLEPARCLPRVENSTPWRIQPMDSILKH